MLKDVLIKLYERDLGRLMTEIERYADEADIWKTDGGISNSGGNLALHLIGNLKHYFGAVLGGTGFVRNRDAEFSTAGVTREELLLNIGEAASIVRATLENLSDDDLAAKYPIEEFGHPMTTGYFFTHLATHLNYHLGQINYHRRLLSGN